MFQKFIDDFRDSTGQAVRLTSLAAVAAFCLFIALSFLCAAAFVYVLQNYGLLEACLAGAGVFFIAALLTIIGYAVLKRRKPKRPPEAAKSTLQAALSDPMVLAAGLQIVRTLGTKRLLSLAAVGGVALGLMAATRRPSDRASDEKE